MNGLSRGFSDLERSLGIATAAVSFALFFADASFSDLERSLGIATRRHAATGRCNLGFSDLERSLGIATYQPINATLNLLMFQ